MARDLYPLSLITPYHVAACSVVSALESAGVDVCASRWAGTEAKIRAIRTAHNAAVVWAHWAWIDKCPAWVLERRVVVILRDPVECAISDYLRGNTGKRVRQAQQWLTLWRHRHAVDEWIDFKDLSMRHYGIEQLPRENTTAEHELKRLYAAGHHRKVRTQIQPQWDCLMVVRREVREVFAMAGLMHRLAPTPFGPRR